MKFKTLGNRNDPAVLFFHAMGVTGESSGRIAEYLQNEYFCIMPTSTVYCEGQKYVSKVDELRQIEEFLKENDVNNLALVVASSMPAKDNPNPAKTPIFSRFMPNSFVCIQRYEQSRLRWKLSEIAA